MITSFEYFVSEDILKQQIDCAKIHVFVMGVNLDSDWHLISKGLNKGNLLKHEPRPFATLLISYFHHLSGLDFISIVAFITY